MERGMEGMRKDGLDGMRKDGLDGQTEGSDVGREGWRE